MMHRRGVNDVRTQEERKKKSSGSNRGGRTAVLEQKMQKKGLVSVG